MRRAGALLAATLLLLAVPAAAQTPPEAPDVEIASERLLMTRGPAGPFVIHMVQLINVGPRIAEQVPLPVPEGAVLLDVPEELVLGDRVVVDPRPLPPGDGRQYIFTYELPWQRLPMPVRRALFYPTDWLEVWVEDSLVLRGVGLRAAGEEELAGRHFTVYVSADLSPHPQWQAVLETASGPAASVSERERLGQRSDPLDIVRAHPLPGLLLLAAVGLFVGAAVARRRGLRGRAGARESGPAVGVEPKATAEGPVQANEVARLKELIVQMDVAFQNGELEQSVYLERRAGLRRELLRRMGLGDERETAAEAGPGGATPTGEDSTEGST